MCESAANIGWVEESPGMFVLSPDTKQAEWLRQRQRELRDQLRRALAGENTQELPETVTET